MSDPRRIEPSVVHVLPDKVGGVASTVERLVRYAGPDALPQDVVLTHNVLDRDTRYGKPVRGARRQLTVENALPLDNLRVAMARLAGAIPAGPGVLVANDWLELAMLTRHDPGRAVVQVVHGDSPYYYDLAARHDAVVDVYVGCSAWIARQLRARLPHRADHIVHLSHGVEIGGPVRTPTNGPLRLLHVGRLDEDKGVHDLPRIDAALRARGVVARWTIVGDGPAREALMRAMPADDRVSHAGVVDREELGRIYAGHDVFVFPSRSEGFGLVLLEAMVAGVVPVSSDLPSGIPEFVRPGETGVRVPTGDIAAFADAIAALERDRATLERWSAASRRLVVERFDVRERTRDYHALFARWAELRRPRAAAPPLHYGSRLDQPWIPNGLVRLVRRATAWARAR